MVYQILNLFEISSPTKNIWSLFLLVALILSLWRQFFGFKDVGYLTTIVMAFLLTTLGWLEGTVLVFLVFLYTIVINMIIKKIVILKLPKDTLFISLATLLTLITLNGFNWLLELNKSVGNFTAFKIDLNAFIMLALAILVLKFKQFLADSSKRYVFNLVFQGTLPVVFSLFLFYWDKFKWFSQTYFGLFLAIALLGLFLIGKYSGLRLTELLKYYKILKQEE